MKTILITGFDPFDQETINPAFEAIKLLPDQILNGRIIKLEVPTQFKKGPQVVIEAIHQYQPDIIMCIGQAGGRSMITPEFVAINHAHARICDNTGEQPLQKKVDQKGPDAYFSTLPVYKMVDALNQQDIPANVSYSAGTFVCNTLMYKVLHTIKINHVDAIAGFIHVPFIEKQVQDKPINTPYMDLEQIVKGLKICIETCLEI